MEYQGYIINLQFCSFPPGIHESVTPNTDGSYTMFLDQNDTKEMQEQAFLHAIEHIKDGDFENVQGKDANKLEAVAHELIEPKAEVTEEPAVTADDLAEWERVKKELDALRDYILTTMALEEIRRAEKAEKSRYRPRRRSKADESFVDDMNEIRDLLGIPRRSWFK